ncbi:MAG: hypothetical protein HC845_12825 [Akkermansiaceae bacterium]|nr:hypothetical protein [Akkermansiaceae bacterium]
MEDTQIVSDINEPKLSGAALAALYRKYTGRRVIVTSGAAAAEFSFVQEATPEDPLTYKEAANLLKKAAIFEGYVLTADEQYPNLDILTLNPGGGIKPGNSGNIKIYNEKDILPEGDAVISYVMSLSYIKPEEAMNIFTQIIGQFGSYGSIAPVPNAAAIVITENASLIRKLIDLKKEIDKPSSQVATKFIKVQYADVTEIATTLTELLTAQQSTQTTAGIQRADIGGQIPPPGTPQAPGQTGGSSGGGEATPIQILPDPRTNRIFAMGRPVDIKFVEGLISEFDVETSEKTVLRRKLHFLKVAEFIPVASDALTRAFSGTGGDSGGGAAAAGGAPGGGAPPRQSNNRQSGGSGRQASGGRNNNTTAGGGLGGGGGSGGGGGESLDAPDASTAPESVLVGRTLLVADNITNSVIVNGPPSALEIVSRLLDQIDVRPDQVMISTVIGQLTLNDNTTVGLDYLKLGNDFVARGGSGAGPVLPIVGTLVDAIDGTPATGTPGQPGFIPAVPGRPAGSSAFQPGNLTGSGLQMYGRIGNNLNAYLTALQSKSDFTVLSRPSIFTANNQKGTISSGERIAIPTSSNSFGNSGNASTNIEYQDVVLKLEVVPLVNSESEITMQIALLNDEQNGTQTISGAGSNGQDLTVPRISTREVLTTVTVPNNETIVLGGLIVSRDTKSKSGIPILSSIPYVGSLFGTTIAGKDRSELIVFMQPSIVQNDRSLQNVQADIDSRYKISDKAHKFADGPGVLPPLDVIPLDEKESKRTKTRENKTPTFSEPDSERKPSIVKPSIRPAHRR